MGAQPIGRPGWPELDLLIASTARKRMLLMQRLSVEVVGATTMAGTGVEGREGAGIQGIRRNARQTL
jgi:hypothetical protein